MRKWQKVLIWCLVILIVLIGSGYCVFKYYIQPKYIDQAVDQVSDILQSEAVQNGVDQFVAELQKEGYLTDDQAEQYRKAADELGLSSVKETPEPEPEESEQPNDRKNPQVSEPDDITGREGSKDKNAKDQKDSEKSATGVKNDGRSKTERVMSALTASELSFVKSIQSKIDVGTASSLMNSDADKFKQYIKSHLSGDEISQCLSLYTKYAYLLSD